MERSELSNRFAGPARRAKLSPIARTLELADRTPDLISFACGNPATEALPVDAIARASVAALKHDTERALQYVRPRGILHEGLLALLATESISAGAENLLPTTGAIQALSLVAHALIEPGDIVVTEAPTYPVNLATFHAHGARVIGVPMDDDGMRTDLLARLLGRLPERPKLLYTIPDAQNPTGITMSAARRRDLVGILQGHAIPLLEDLPYRGVHYRGAPAPTLYHLAQRAGASALLVGSFAKIVAPGLRVGYLLAEPEIIDACVLIKQGEDFCTSGLAQLIIERLIKNGEVERSVARIRDAQRPKLAAMLEGLEAELGDLPGTRWTRPLGGLFVWLSLPTEFDTDLLLERAIEEKVAFIPGRHFYPPEIAGSTGEPMHREPPAHEIRLNFSDPPLASIRPGIRALARVIRNHR